MESPIEVVRRFCLAWSALGVDVSEVAYPTAPGAQFQSNGTSGRASGPAPNHATYSSFATFSDPDGNTITFIGNFRVQY